MLSMEALDSNMPFLPYRSRESNLLPPRTSPSPASGTVSQIKGSSAGTQGGSHTPWLSEMDRELHGSPTARTGEVLGRSDFRTLAPCLCSSAYPGSTTHVQSALAAASSAACSGVKGSKSTFL